MNSLDPTADPGPAVLVLEGVSDQMAANILRDGGYQAAYEATAADWRAIVHFANNNRESPLPPDGVPPTQLLRHDRDFPLLKPEWCARALDPVLFQRLRSAGYVQPISCPGLPGGARSAFRTHQPTRTDSSSPPVTLPGEQLHTYPTDVGEIRETTEQLRDWTAQAANQIFANAPAVTGWEESADSDFDAQGHLIEVLGARLQHHDWFAPGGFNILNNAGTMPDMFGCKPFTFR